MNADKNLATRPPHKVIVCGTRFGEHYLAALAQQRPGYQLCGILARGSARSVALARQLGIPLYRQVDQLPADIDIACVAVRTSIVGGDGTRLASALLQRGIHVLQEHPLHPTDTQRLLSTAREHGVRYQINTLYPHLPAGQRFIQYVRQGLTQQPMWFIEMTTSLQLLYSSLDILGRALGGLAPFAVSAPLSLETLARPAHPWPFRSLQGVLAGIPLSLHLQTYLDHRDLDHHSLVMHRISCGGPQGNILLANSYGPVVWSHPIYAPNYQGDGADASYLLNGEALRSSRYNRQPTAITFGPAQAPSLNEAVEEDIPHAIFRALDELMQEPSPDSPHWVQHGQTWLDIMRAVGQPVMTELAPPCPPFPDPVSYAREHAHAGR